MSAWLAANLGTILVSLLLAGIVILIIRKMINDKRQGKSTCGCGCSNCAMSGSCHGNVNRRPETKGRAFEQKD